MTTIVFKGVDDQIEVTCFGEVVCLVNDIVKEELKSMSAMDFRSIVRKKIVDKLGAEYEFNLSDFWLGVAVIESFGDYGHPDEEPLRAITLKDADDEIELTCFDKVLGTIAKPTIENLKGWNGLDIEYEIVKIIRTKIADEFGDKFGFTANDFWLVVVGCEALSKYLKDELDRCDQ
jgi:hypothetical protein